MVDKLLESEFMDDLFLQNEVIKEIPVLNFISGIRKVGLSIRDYRFTRNLLKLLKDYSSIPQKDRYDFSYKYFNNKDDKKYFSEKMISTLENIDYSKKVDLLSLIIKKRIYNKIDNDEFFNLLDIVVNIKYHLMIYFFDFYIFDFFLERYIVDHFYHIGILQSTNHRRTTSKETEFEASHLGKLFFEFFLQKKNNNKFKLERINFYLNQLDYENENNNFKKMRKRICDKNEILVELKKIPIEILIEKSKFHKNFFKCEGYNNSFLRIFITKLNDEKFILYYVDK